ncbi:hypothetical protein [Phenylobacterium sp.]|uniref:hypothetical protein n=1 Tax=Phenylobacterium sp. TaxID=1871053 RepID=UPI0039835EBE
MRIALASLILVAGLAGAVQAQTPATPDPNVVRNMPADQVQLVPAAPAPAPTAVAPAPAPPPPTVPTTGDGAVVLSVLERVCVPAVRGQSIDDLAKAMGMKKNRRDMSWAMGLGSHKTHQIIVLAQGSNKNSCVAEVRFAVGQEAPIVSAINIWSFVHQPELLPTANYVQPVDPDGLKRVRKSWESVTSTSSTGLNFSTVRKPDDSPLNRNYDTGMMFYQERTF